MWGMDDRMVFKYLFTMATFEAGASRHCGEFTPVGRLGYYDTYGKVITKKPI